MTTLGGRTPCLPGVPGPPGVMLPTGNRSGAARPEPEFTELAEFADGSGDVFP